MFSIYLITNTNNKRQYIGSTGRCPASRWARHMSALKHSIHPNKELQKDWDAGSITHFTFNVLEQVDDKSRAQQLEAQMVSKLKNAYNDFYHPQGKEGTNGNARLTPDNVKTIRELLKTMPVGKIAEKFGVTHPLICNIRNGKRFAWVE
jgi:uncharacterized protein (DUF2267 family)